MSSLGREFLQLSRAVRAEADKLNLPAEKLKRPRQEPVLLGSVFADSPYYIVSAVNQINACYNASCYDACAVMIRRLLEILILEVYEGFGLTQDIEDANGTLLRLGIMIDKTISCKRWTLSKNTKRGMRDLKDLGDLSAHVPRYVATRGDIDRLYLTVRVVTQELLFLSQTAR